jgi:hypothetical protein
VLAHANSRTERAELMTTRVKREADWLRASRGRACPENPDNHAGRPAKTIIALLRCNVIWQKVRRTTRWFVSHTVWTADSQAASCVAVRKRHRASSRLRCRTLDRRRVGRSDFQGPSVQHLYSPTTHDCNRARLTQLDAAVRIAAFEQAAMSATKPLPSCAPQ